MKKNNNSIKLSLSKILVRASDILLILLNVAIAHYIYRVDNTPLSGKHMVIAAFFSAALCVLILEILGNYKKPWKAFGAQDFMLCVLGIFTAFSIDVFILNLRFSGSPYMFYVLYAVLCAVSICIMRVVFKYIFIIVSDAGRKTADIKRTLIIGGGNTCKAIIKEIQLAQNENSEMQIANFEPVCIVDDDRHKLKTKVRGVPIVGNTSEIVNIVAKYSIEQIIFAIPSCSEDKKKDILNICSGTGLPVRLVPKLGNLLLKSESTTVLNQIRDINIEDLLGRKAITFDSEDIKNFVCGKVCMVTGGGGSIGSEIVRQLARYEPKKIIIVDIYENNAYDIQQELRMEFGGKLDFVTLIASVRDFHRMDRIYETYKPEIVFHAAAHKHVPLMENSPAEAIKNNVLGTFNVATLALAHNVSRFVMISTDKAVNPTNVMGASKRCCEMIIQYLSQQPDCQTDFVTTRFGNVLGSNGSVIPLFKRQIEQGKPLTVTHPDIIRYFMTIPEAVNLVLEASVLAQGGEIFVLDMGKPVRIVTLAENLIRMYGKRPYKDVQIVFTGLRPGEKIKEELLMDEEGLQKTSNDLIFIGKHIELNEDEFINDIHALKQAASDEDEDGVVAALHRIVPTFVTPEEFNTKELSKK
ncbi:MAG: polysaccharide biosynthesis protein [Clostridia bacterium]|nr:polysaccharide biosynthesis protein [Clostridia bacterium]